MSNKGYSDDPRGNIIQIPMSGNSKSTTERGKYWENDFGKEFPISHIDDNGKEATITVGVPHLDYQIVTHMRNQQMNGESTLISNKNIIIATLTFVDGIANGPCTLYDEDGVLFFEGYFVNGYRQGRGKEYDSEGRLVNQGLYEKGKRLYEMSEMSGYWKEYDENTILQCVYRKDSDGNNNGVCFYYENGVVSRLTEWNNGKETPYNGYFRLYDEPNYKWIEGEFKNGIRNGYSKEYDRYGKIQFDGYCENGKQLNMVRLSEMDGYWLEYDEGNHLKSICKKDNEGRYEDICYFYEENKLIRISKWHEGIETPFSGYFKIYDEPQKTWIDGFYVEGKILKLYPMKEMNGYWKELDENDTLIHICEIDENGKYNGICYYFENGKMKEISRWEEGKEESFNGYFKYYDEDNGKWMEGYYENGKQLNMVRLSEMNGYWLEYDDNDNLKSICKKDNEGRYEDICYFYEENKLIRISKWHEGIETSTNGHCVFYNQPYKIWFEGNFENGLREGHGKEYTTYRNVSFEGQYKSGNKRIKMSEKKNYWKEVDDNGTIVRICQIDKNGKYDGLSYLYNNGQILRVSHWKEGKEIEVSKVFYGNRMTEFKDGVKQYEGEFINSLDSNYCRNGEGEEYDTDGKSLIYKGTIKNGKRSGRGKLFENKKLVYDGKWVKGFKIANFYSYMALAFTFMILIATGCFLLFNGYVGAIVTGIFITATCYYFNFYLGLFFTGLFIVMNCYFINIYAGIIASLILVTIVLACYHWLLGTIPISVCLVVLCYYINTHAGIFASGLLLIYVIFIICKFNDWGMDIVGFSALITIFFCIIMCLVVELKKYEALIHAIIIATGLLLLCIYIVIAYYCDLSISIFVFVTLIIVISCGIASIVAELERGRFMIHILIMAIGLLLIIISLAITCFLDCIFEFFICTGSIIGLCISIILMLQLNEHSSIKYYLIYSIGLTVLLLVSICNPAFIMESAFFIIATLCICTIISLSINVKEIPNLKYAIMFVAALLIIDVAGLFGEDAWVIVGVIVVCIYLILTYIFALIDFQIVRTITYWILGIIGAIIVAGIVLAIIAAIL